MYIANANGEKVHLDPRTLTRHAICLGSTGSGKTVAAKVICEEFAMAGIPVIAIDSQGDIARIAQTADPGDLEGRAVPEIGPEGFRRLVDVALWTPGTRAGIPLNLNPVDVTGLVAIPDPEVRLDAIGAAAITLAALLDYSDNEPGRNATAVLTVVLRKIVADHRMECRHYEALADFIAKPPEDIRSSLNSIMPKRKDLIRRLHRLNLGPNARLLSVGHPLNIPHLLGTHNPDPVRTRISVVCSHLVGNEAQELTVARVASELYTWMVSTPVEPDASGETPIRALLFIDEAHDHLPPTNRRKPLSKEPLERLLREARKYGVCILLASQNPGDLDYKCMGQINTWYVGRIAEQQSLAKIAAPLRSVAGEHADSVLEAIPGLEGEFISICEGEARRQQFRWLLTKHGSPLGRDAIASLVSDYQRELRDTEPESVAETPPEPEPEPEPVAETPPEPEPVAETPSETVAETPPEPEPVAETPSDEDPEIRALKMEIYKLEQQMRGTPANSHAADVLRLPLGEKKRRLYRLGGWPPIGGMDEILQNLPKP